MVDWVFALGSLLAGASAAAKLIEGIWNWAKDSVLRANY